MPEQHEVMNTLLAEAHERHTRSRARGAYVVSELTRLQGSGTPWVSSLLAKWMVDGAMERCKSWRNGQRRAAHTKRGKATDVSEWVGVTTRTDDGVVEHLALPLEDVTIDQARVALSTLSKRRNTLSATISVYERAIAHMEANPGCSFSDAMDVAA